MKKTNNKEFIKTIVSVIAVAIFVIAMMYATGKYETTADRYNKHIVLCCITALFGAVAGISEIILARDDLDSEKQFRFVPLRADGVAGMILGMVAMIMHAAI